jgi:hypothetical protein
MFLVPAGNGTSVLQPVTVDFTDQNMKAVCVMPHTCSVFHNYVRLMLRRRRIIVTLPSLNGVTLYIVISVQGGARKTEEQENVNMFFSNFLHTYVQKFM